MGTSSFAVPANPATGRPPSLTMLVEASFSSREADPRAVLAESVQEHDNRVQIVYVRDGGCDARETGASLCDRLMNGSESDAHAMVGSRMLQPCSALAMLRRRLGDSAPGAARPSARF